MGWFLRRGRRFYYQSIWRDGRPCKDYVTADTPAGRVLVEQLEADRRGDRRAGNISAG